jgi:pimeloyl-ACP methyl ester carboxylesterase
VLVRLPQSWRTGDAAAIMLFHPPAAMPLRNRLVAALLDRGAAVVEVDANVAEGFAADPDAVPVPPTTESLLRDFRAVARALRAEYGPGVVVAMGHGLGGEAALMAADPDLGDTGFAAVASLGPATPAFRAGPPPPPDEAWPLRAPMLCEALAWTHATAATPLTEDPDHRARQAAAERDCGAALLTRPASRPLAGR